MYAYAKAHVPRGAEGAERRERPSEGGLTREAPAGKGPLL